MDNGVYINFIQQLLLDFFLLLLFFCVVAEIVIYINANKTRILNEFNGKKGYTKFLILIAIVVYGGTKPASNTTNSIKLENGYKAETMAVPELSSGASVDASNERVVVDHLLKHGGHTYGITLDLSDTPLSNSVLEKVKIFANGSLAFYGWNEKIYINPVLGEDVSIAPYSNWGLLQKENAQSLLSYEFTSSNTLLITWQDALYKRKANDLVSFDVEVYSDAKYKLRYAGDVFYEMVCPPFDIDGDGLENSVDPEPHIKGDDAHGTNAEWMSVVCSNIFHKAETNNQIRIDWNEGVQTNAYYFIDIVTDKNLTPIYIVADVETRLGNPIIIAQSGVTNHLPLQVGIGYSITSSVPIKCTSVSSEHVKINYINEKNIFVRFPLNLDINTFTTATGVSGNFQTSPIDLSVAMSISGHCCGSVVHGNNFNFNKCVESCSCGGCESTLKFTLEGYLYCAIPLSGCECKPNDDDDDNPIEDENNSSEGNENPKEAYINVSLDTDTIIFEDEYENQQNDIHSRKSTKAILKCSGNGGKDGGFVYFSTEGRSNCIGGNKIFMLQVAPHEKFTKTFELEGFAPSNEKNDILFVGKISSGGKVKSSSASMTVVEVSISPCALIPNSFSHRHIFGSAEQIYIYLDPYVNGMMIEIKNILKLNAPESEMICTLPILANIYDINISLDKTSLTVNTQVIEPSTILGSLGLDKTGKIIDYGLSEGVAGGIGMEMILTLYPTNVSFKNIQVVEGVSENNDVTGYFDNVERFYLWWYHTEQNGANIINEVMDDTNNTLLLYDNISMNAICPQPWSNGSIIWDIPCLFGAKNSPINTMKEFTRVQQIFSIKPNGTVSIEKFGSKIERHTDGKIYLNGVEVKK